jgi:hypothetical protein
MRIACLCDSTSEPIQHAGILPRACQFAKSAIQFVALTGSQFRNRAHSQFQKIGLDGPPHSRKIAQAPLAFTPVSTGLVCP